MRDEEFFIHRYVEDQMILVTIILLKLTYAGLMKGEGMFRLGNIARTIMSRMKKVRASVQTGQYSKTGDNSVSIQAGRDAYMVRFPGGREVKTPLGQPLHYRWTDEDENQFTVEIHA